MRGFLTHCLSNETGVDSVVLHPTEYQEMRRVVVLPKLHAQKTARCYNVMTLGNKSDLEGFNRKYVCFGKALYFIRKYDYEDVLPSCLEYDLSLCRIYIDRRVIEVFLYNIMKFLPTKVF